MNPLRSPLFSFYFGWIPTTRYTIWDRQLYDGKLCIDLVAIVHEEKQWAFSGLGAVLDGSAVLFSVMIVSCADLCFMRYLFIIWYLSWPIDQRELYTY
jgi:hypothetical protein